MAADPILEPLRADPAARRDPLRHRRHPGADRRRPRGGGGAAEAAQRSLAELAERYRLVACVSGRRASAARRMVGVDAAHLRRQPRARAARRRATRDRASIPSSATAARRRPGSSRGSTGIDLGAVGLRLEDKGPIQAIHWRGAPDAETAAQRAREVAVLAEEEGLIAAPRAGWCSRSGRWPRSTRGSRSAGWSRRPGSSERALRRRRPHRPRRVRRAARARSAAGELERAVCVGVASAEAPPEIEHRADLVVAGPKAFLDLLRSL